MVKIFRILLTEYGEKFGVDVQCHAMEAPCLMLRRALKESATEALGRNSTDRGQRDSNIHLHVDVRVFLWE